MSCSASSRRSEPGALEENVLADEKALAREILGKHYSDVDDVTSSESEEEFKSSADNLTSNFPKGASDSNNGSELTDSEGTESDSTSDSPEEHSDNDMQISSSSKLKEPIVSYSLRQNLRRRQRQSAVSDSSSGQTPAASTEIKGL